MQRNTICWRYCPKDLPAAKFQFQRKSFGTFQFLNRQGFSFLHHSNSYQHDFILFHIFVIRQETHSFPFLLRIGLHTEILSQVKSKFHDWIGNILEIRCFLRTIEQNKQIPIGAFTIIASCARTIKKQMGILWKNHLCKLLDLLQYVYVAHCLLTFCRKSKKFSPHLPCLSDFFLWCDRICRAFLR